MTALTGTSSFKAQEHHQVDATDYLEDLSRNIGDAVSTFPGKVSNLVAEYLAFSGWTSQWAGDLGRELITRNIEAVETPLFVNHNLVDLILGYLRVEIFGLKELEEAANGGEVLAKLLPGYAPEHQLPTKIEEIVQTDLCTVFSPEALIGIRARKVGELYFFCWRPKNMTANISNAIARNAPKNPVEFSGDSWQKALRDHGDDAPAAKDSWIQFPYDVIGRNKSFDQQEALVPKGYEVSRFCDAVYCSQIYSVFTGRIIFFADSPTGARCPEKTDMHHVIVWPLVDGCCIKPNLFESSPNRGVAVVRKFSAR